MAERVRVRHGGRRVQARDEGQGEKTVLDVRPEEQGGSLSLVCGKMGQRPNRKTVRIRDGRDVPDVQAVAKSIEIDAQDRREPHAVPKTSHGRGQTARQEEDGVLRRGVRPAK